MDYGHAVAFGVFITPTNAAPRAPVALARLAEQVGLDLVTFQDHPYQPAFHDTWTLMSYIAAQTERIRIAPNVLNLPLRQPAVLARSAASLDLLSGGRLDLGLGAGAFWDAIEAMGAERLTPGQAVTALEEGIDIIRGIWDTDARGGVRVDGRYHRATGAKRGPRPAHPIPIWLGAYKPRMLALTGRRADGWLPSYAYLQPGRLADGNAAIDEAAASVGRDPREIRRLLNVAPASGTAGWVEQLATLALEDGESVFIVATDDPDVMRLVGDEVAPAVRELVAAERARTGTGTAPVRSAAALAARRAGIAYDDVPAGLAAVEPGDFRFGAVRSNYLRGGDPGIVLEPADAAQVREALAFARRHPSLPLGVRSGGHGVSGRSTNDGGIVVDLRRLDAIDVLDERARRVRVGAGARWTDVAAALGAHGWALSSGDYGGVGVGGLATAGGIGWLAREHGLTIDHVVAAELVLADGTVTRVDADSDPELFWGIRGAGAALGIVTSFEFVVDAVGDIAFAQFAFDASDAAGFLERFGTAVEAAPRILTPNLFIGGRRPGQPRVAQVLSLVDSDDPDEIVAALQPLADIAPLLQQDVRLQRYADVMGNASTEPHRGRGEPVSRSLLVDRLSPGFAADAAVLLDSGATHWFQVRAVGGAVADVAADATPYADRSANFSVIAMGSDDAELDAAWAPLARHATGAYISFESKLDAERLTLAFPTATARRLRVLKARVDPDNVFRDNIDLALLRP
ncbi:LLM class flavin-dependent oxidoreductase [Galbitalea sp. SE-J8]|uniref:LLM class flavin-dependent oxidoreductase n=1 Tax=Galbitalea sp. SE-J8 TaxID=3054952 RepID=UPI00259C7E3B|nr:LLM class flavin-dependent oxidoreductase [Galbitalea sp. SE-J8]MDM4762583.1 LLM class flavin-dependent oxidoreductase [Galbitalea sp. SE-J8]